MSAKDSAPDGSPSSERPSVGEVIFVVESCPEGGFTARGLGQSVFAQGESLGLLQAVFGRYPQHRALLLEDVLALLPKLPQGKRGLRTFRLHYRALTLGSEGQNIQVVTALVLLLLQSAVTRPRRLLRALAWGAGLDSATVQTFLSIVHTLHLLSSTSTSLVLIF